MEKNQKALEQMQNMLDPKNQVRMLRVWIAMGSVEMVKQCLDQADLFSDGPEYLAVSRPIS